MSKLVSQRAIFAAILILILISLNIGISFLNNGFLTYKGTVEIEEGQTLYYIVNTPKKEGSKPLAVILHGLGGSSEMMQMIASELANNGVLTISLDSRGHGKSGASLGGNISFYNDFLKILDVAEIYGANTDSITVIGHSMGAGFAQSLLKNDSRIRCLVLIGSTPISDYIDKNSKVNVLVVNGRYDELTSLSDGLKAFKNISNIENIEVGTTYGSFEENNAREFYISNLSDHLTILYSVDGIRKIVDWVAQFYNIRNLTFSNDLRLIVYLLIAFVAYVLIFPILGRLRDRYEQVEKSSIRPPNLIMIVLIYLLASLSAAPFAIFLQFLFVIIAPLFITSFLLGFFYSQIVAMYITLYVHKRATKEGFRELFSIHFVKDRITLRIVYGIIISVIVYLLYYVMLKNFFNVEISVFRIGYIVVTAILLLPYIVFNEVFFRIIVSKIGKGRFNDIFYSLSLRVLGLIILYVALLILFGTSGGLTGYLTILIYMTAALQVSLDLISLYMFRKTQSITEQIIWNTIIFSILLTAVSPVL